MDHGGVFRLPALAIVIGPSVWPVSSEIANTASRPWSCAHRVKRRCHSRAAAFDPKRPFAEGSERPAADYCDPNIDSLISVRLCTTLDACPFGLLSHFTAILKYIFEGKVSIESRQFHLVVSMTDLFRWSDDDIPHLLNDWVQIIDLLGIDVKEITALYDVYSI